ncbi:hypothetical protein [Desulfohalovibrio reitneri]|uniref:hypothetical protein n=1 Tax=Desulfohalovibrio reitneri TaxID=1307759 RepID=UPI0004A73AAD|nr:hypothetical protein [Desulfohalovibrio reitneri]
MDKALLKLARQLNAFDEASLTSLFERYADQVDRFEPSQRWEEAVLVLGMIQAVRFKNQLFNHHWSRTAEPDAERPTHSPEPAPEPETPAKEEGRGESAGPSGRNGGQKRGKVLRFVPRDDG